MSEESTFPDVTWPPAPSGDVAWQPGEGGPYAGPESAAPPRPTGSDRLGLLLAFLLALTGLFGALIAWRLSDADLQAGDAARAGLAATRERSRAVLTAESEVAGSQAAWLRYELAHRRADALTAAGQPVEALRAAKEAASNWAFVRSEFVRPDGTYDVAAHRRTTLAQIASGSDLDAAPHFAVAAAAESKKHQLALAGILIAGTLPLLAIASVTHRRAKVIATLAGTAMFTVSSIALVLTWL
jgi:hypothetical protein